MVGSCLHWVLVVTRRWRVQGWQGWQIKKVNWQKCGYIGYKCGNKVWRWLDVIWCVSRWWKLSLKMASARANGWSDEFEICWVHSCMMYVWIWIYKHWGQICRRGLHWGLSWWRRWWVQGWQWWQIKNVNWQMCVYMMHECGNKVWRWSDKIWIVSKRIKEIEEMRSARVWKWTEMDEILEMNYHSMYIYGRKRNEKK